MKKLKVFAILFVLICGMSIGSVDADTTIQDPWGCSAGSEACMSKLLPSGAYDCTVDGNKVCCVKVGTCN
jgi:hypothetical protein